MTRRDDTGTENDAGTRVGWIGLGAMGSPMAGCMARAGFDVSAYDIDPARAEALATDGVKPAVSINEAASGADVLVVMVATPDQVESVLFGDDPAAGALAAGAAVVDFEITRRLSDLAVADASSALVLFRLHGPRSPRATPMSWPAGSSPHPARGAARWCATSRRSITPWR